MNFVDIIEDIKEKLTDNEYKNLMENIPKNKMALLQHIYTVDYSYDAYYSNHFIKKRLKKTNVMLISHQMICVNDINNNCGDCIICDLKRKKKIKVDKLDIEINLKYEIRELEQTDEILVYYEEETEKEIFLEVENMFEYELLIID